MQTNEGGPELKKKKRAFIMADGKTQAEGNKASSKLHWEN